MDIPQKRYASKKYNYVFISNKSTPCSKQIYNRTKDVMETTKINTKEAKGGME
jgi:hypothetical protein